MGFLLMIRKKKQFDGQLFIIYLITYAAGRSILEILRGDAERGFIIDGILSHSQMISILIAGAGIYFYVKLRRKGKLLSTK